MFTKKNTVCMILLCLIAKLTCQIDAQRKTKKHSSLNAKHFVVGGVQSASGILAVRNASGHVISARGTPVFMLEWLSLEYNFTFSYLPTHVTTIDAMPGQKGLINYVMDGLCDIALPVVPTSQRTIVLDYTHPFLYIPVSYLIPFGESFANISAVAKPFQPWVWIGVLLATATIILLFYLIDAIYKEVSCMAPGNGKSMRAIPDYVLGVVLSQGGYCTNQRNAIRILATCWCLASVALVYSYNSVLIAYLTLSNPDILINNIEQLKDRPDLQLVTDKGLSTEARLLASEKGLFKALGDKLRNYPKSRCNTTEQCVTLVREGSHVYTSVIRDDYALTKKCNFRLGKRPYMNLELSWGVIKRNPIIKELNEGIVRLYELGLVDHWQDAYEVDASKCIAMAKEHSHYPRLSLHQLTGAFIVLFTGFILSILAFAFEMRGCIMNTL